MPGARARPTPSPPPRRPARAREREKLETPIVSNQALPPGSTIGIIGGGQLGRMTAMAAATLGYRSHVFTPEADSPASQVATRTTEAAYEDTAALDAFAQAVD